MDIQEIEQRAIATVKMLGYTESNCEGYNHILGAFCDYFIMLEWQNNSKQNDKEENKEEAQKT
jgi:hypothetical protein